MLNIDTLFLDSRYSLEIKGKFKITITIRDRVTVLTGESGTGKTQLVKLINSVKNSRNLTSLAKFNFPLDRIEVIQNPKEFNSFAKDNLSDKNKSSVKDRLIIIDRLDKCNVTQEWLDFINNSDNVFILITRFRNQNDASSDIVVRLNSMRCIERRYVVDENGKGEEKKTLCLEDVPAI